jgi:hypothetical protein
MNINQYHYRQLKHSITIDQYSSDRAHELLQEMQQRQQGAVAGKLRSNRTSDNQRTQVALPEISTQYVSLFITNVSIIIDMWQCKFRQAQILLSEISTQYVL